MRAKVAQALRKRFETELTEVLPQFRPDKESEIPAGWRCYRWSASEELHFFVLLELRQMFDEFSVVCGWSTRPAMPVRDSEGVEDPEGVFTLHGLWNPRSPTGWNLTPGAGLLDGPTGPIGSDFGELPPVAEALARVPETVADAVGKLVTHGLPVFRQVAAARGRTLDLTVRGGHE